MDCRLPSADASVHRRRCVRAKMQTEHDKIYPEENRIVLTVFQGAFQIEVE